MPIEELIAAAGVNSDGKAAWNEPADAVNGAALAAVSTPRPGNASWKEPGAGVKFGATSLAGKASSPAGTGVASTMGAVVGGKGVGWVNNEPDPRLLLIAASVAPEAAREAAVDAVAELTPVETRVLCNCRFA
jgi:hypothetical protein